jgi:hypothetical protein
MYSGCMQEWQIQAIRDARKRIEQAFEHASPVLIRTIEDYERVARLVAPALERLQQHEEITIPMVEETLRDQSFDIEITPSAPEQKEEDVIEEIARRVVELMREKQKPGARASYPLPKDAKWGRLRLKFFDGHTIKASYPGLPIGTFDYKDMGFVNRKTHNPDAKWNFLRALAQNGGRLTVAKWDKKFDRNTKYEVGKRLKAFFAMEAEPFPRYTKEDGYAPLFVILPDTDIAPLEEK